MLLLLLQLDGDRYALDTRDVVEVLPLVECKAVPGAPAGVAGIIDYGGTAVPVVDLSQLLANRAAHRRLSTRIVLVETRREGSGRKLLGLIAERTTETMRRERHEFRPPGIARPSAPKIDGVALDAEGPVYLLDVATLLPEPIRLALLQPMAAAG